MSGNELALTAVFEIAALAVLFAFAMSHWNRAPA
jgi:hypothetical protein